MTEHQPLFETSREALTFALNTSAVIPRPMFNRAMAETPRSKAIQSPEEIEAELTQAARQLNTGPRRTSLRGLEASAQAGMILLHLGRIDEHQHVILTGLLSHPWDPCACGAPCCSGKRITRRYAEAFKRTCEIVDEAGEMLRRDGKKHPMSPQPKLRKLLVEQFLCGQTATLTDIAHEAEVSMATAAKHRDWVMTLLSQIEDEAWLAIDPILVGAGIVGDLG